MLRDPASEKEYASVPELEPENGKAGERLKFTIDRTGKEAFEKAIKEAYENE